jgi:allophanate hydrolase
MIARKITIDYLKRGYASGEFEPEDICREIERRAAQKRDMNIWIYPPRMEDMTKYIERLKTLDRDKCPLWGIPFAVKDNIDLENVPTTAGCEAYAYIPSKSAAVVRLLVDAGAIPIGKTNLDQFATGLVGTRSPYGAVHNALNPERISGGSSSGSAVAVATGQAAFALGTDTAGSGRVPAALNALVGMKPTCGAWSTAGVVPACESLDCVTVFAHTVEDAAQVDKIARTEDAGCSWSKKTKATVAKPPQKIYIPEWEPEFFGQYADEYRAAWRKALEKIKTLGIPIEAVDDSIFAEAAAILYDGPWIAERWASLGDFVEKNAGRGMVPVTEKILRSGNRKELHAEDVFKAMHRLAEIKREAKNLLCGNVLFMPTTGGTYTIEQVNADPIATNSNLGRYTNHCNLLDLCAVSFPAGYAGKELPFGVTAFAPAEEDGSCVWLAQAYRRLDTTMVAVCGLHMRGFALEYQLADLGAKFVREDRTAPEYRLYKLQTTPVKPGLVRTPKGGVSIEVEIWEMPTDRLGAFLAGIPSPLGLGRIKLSDGSEVVGFLCESCAAEEGEDISSLGSFKKAVSGKTQINK